ncbi:MAG: tetratricopeptide repeat protein [Povalibacter sp.]
MRAVLHGFIALMLVPLICNADEVTDSHAAHGLGKVEFPISCSAPAQAQFNRALALLHHMTYPQASEAFEQVAASDPQCAMAQWGIAMTLFQPLWPTRPKPAALQKGWDATQKAKSLHPQTDREGLFIAAAEAFFLEPSGTDYWLRIRRWEQAQQKAYEALPNDPEAAVFYALAHLATTPADKPGREHADRAAAILLKVYEHNPDHPGAMHYLVHANDVPGREHELLEITNKYAKIAPDNPHALHMPTHIYTRLGDWDGVIKGNLRSADAALKYPAGEKGEYVWDEFPHAIEYLVYAYLQKGDDAAAAEQLKRLQQTERIEPTFKKAFHFSSTQARYALERRDWNQAMLLVPRQPADLAWDRFPWPEATVVFARGVGAAHLKKLGEAEAALKRLEELESASQATGETLFTRNIGVLRLELSAWLAQAEGRSAQSRAFMREAMVLESSTPKPPVTPAPTLPASEQLGDLLLEQKQPAEALEAYQKSLERYPQRFNSFYGAAQAATASGDAASARKYYQQLIDLAGSGTRQPALGQARAYLSH